MVITLKTCSRCKQDLDIENFRKMKKSNGYKNGTCSWCKECERIASLERYKANREHCIAMNKQYKIDHYEILKQKRKEYLAKTAEHVKERYKAYCIKNRAFLNKLAKDYLQNNPTAKLRATYSSRLCDKIKKDKPSGKYLGASYELVKNWIEFNFNDEMSWNNHGEVWHIDHTIPINSFDASNNIDIFICFNWKNLMPLHKTHNQKKSDKIIPIRIHHQEIQLKKFILQYQDLKQEVNDYLNLYSTYFSKYFKLSLYAT